MSKVLNRCKAGPMVQEHDLDPRTRTCRRCHMPESVMYLDKEAFERHMNEPTQPAPETGVPLPSEPQRVAMALLHAMNGLYPYAAAEEFKQLGPQVMGDLLTELESSRSALLRARQALKQAIEYFQAFARYDHVEQHLEYENLAKADCPDCQANAAIVARWSAALSGETREETTTKE